VSNAQGLNPRHEEDRLLRRPTAICRTTESTRHLWTTPGARGALGGGHHSRTTFSPDGFRTSLISASSSRIAKSSSLRASLSRRFLACSIIHTVRDGFRIVAIRTRARAPRRNGRDWIVDFAAL
jgi:hypothetical protein